MAITTMIVAIVIAVTLPLMRAARPTTPSTEQSTPPHYRFAQILGSLKGLRSWDHYHVGPLIGPGTGLIRQPVCKRGPAAGPDGNVGAPARIARPAWPGIGTGTQMVLRTSLECETWCARRTKASCRGPAICVSGAGSGSSATFNKVRATASIAIGWMRILGTTANGPTLARVKICPGKSWNCVDRTTAVRVAPVAATNTKPPQMAVRLSVPNLDRKRPNSPSGPDSAMRTLGAPYPPD
ncbi:hypothetical protein N9D66_00815 [Candidatus Nanopelagicales bacterium]|nr:hypothetical protein [Candidatus Nanopelagicales bacterium]